MTNLGCVWDFLCEFKGPGISWITVGEEGRLKLRLIVSGILVSRVWGLGL